ncbi:Zinc finger protein ZPR1 [Psilocybe cubensis]|uniref:Zinc finger ZPR1-type domain-containing protein n=2 Tax=Psilocybe cubensis TaxID=181762 RepID=A0A8H8CGE6_PSICU|nr:Zinc finger protein ZPR1 [Psilocybe cubensis]KAH9475521.1 Zinc finger protein ZPR1 [Psilocybe cubensis]
MAHKEELFPAIGEIAAKTDEIPAAETEEGSKTEGGENFDNEDKVVQEIESLCMKCHEQGVTRLMLTSIPFFREVIVMSFRCEYCGASNNEIQSAGEIRPEGTLYTAKILERKDLNRQIVRSASCEITIPELDLTLPPTNRGQLTTVEGLIRDVVSDLSMDQPLRRIQDEVSYTKIQEIIDKMKPILGDPDDDEEVQEQADYLNLPLTPFTVKLDDPAGNSFIEFYGGMSDPKWNLRTYHRTLEQNVALGLVAADDAQAQSEVIQEEVTPEAITDDEVFVFDGLCSSCGHAIKTNMKKVNIPYFKDILIMSTNCEFCGYRDNEVKSGAAISPQGKRIILKCEDREDLSRDILKSETAGLTIPEIDLVLTHGTLGGRFTTVEGILEQIYEELADKAFAGDSSNKEDKEAYEAFLKGLKEVKNAERPFTIILDDPLANSYMQNLYAPDPDPNMTIELYDRTFEQNEELGLNDIKVEGYEEDAASEKKDEGNDKETSNSV